MGSFNVHLQILKTILSLLD